MRLVVIFVLLASCVFSEEAGFVEWAQSLAFEGNCSGCSSQTIEVEDSDVLVLMSFSVPDAAWLSLSQEMEQVGGAFVLRGLPNNSFRELYQILMRLRDLGVSVPIQIDPKRFEEFSVRMVPSFVIRHKEGFDKVSGNVSLRFALGLMGGMKI